jgi:hypothetical protein
MTNCSPARSRSGGRWRRSPYSRQGDFAMFQPAALLMRQRRWIIRVERNTVQLVNT